MIPQDFTSNIANIEKLLAELHSRAANIDKVVLSSVLQELKKVKGDLTQYSNKVSQELKTVRSESAKRPAGREPDRALRFYQCLQLAA